MNRHARLIGLEGGGTKTEWLLSDDGQIAVKASNAKLRDRATRIVAAIRSCTREEAEILLANHHWHVSDCLPPTSAP